MIVARNHVESLELHEDLRDGAGLEPLVFDAAQGPLFALIAAQPRPIVREFFVFRDFFLHVKEALRD